MRVEPTVSDTALDNAAHGCVCHLRLGLNAENMSGPKLSLASHLLPHCSHTQEVVQRHSLVAHIDRHFRNACVELNKKRFLCKPFT